MESFIPSYLILHMSNIAFRTPVNKGWKFSVGLSCKPFISRVPSFFFVEFIKKLCKLLHGLEDE